MELLLFSSTHNKPHQTIYFHLPPLFLLAKGFLSAVKRKTVHPQKPMPIFSTVMDHTSRNERYGKKAGLSGRISVHRSMHHPLKVRLSLVAFFSVLSKEILLKMDIKSLLGHLVFFPSLVATDCLIPPLCPSGRNQFACR